MDWLTMLAVNNQEKISQFLDEECHDHMTYRFPPGMNWNESVPESWRHRNLTHSLTCEDIHLRQQLSIMLDYIEHCYDCPTGKR